MVIDYKEWREKVDPRKVTFAGLVSQWRWGGCSGYEDVSLNGFAEAYGLPLRSVHNWISGERTPPEYVLMLTAFAMHRDGRLPYDMVRREDADFPV